MKETGEELKDGELLRERKRRILSPRNAVFFVLSLALGVYLIRKLELKKTVDVLLNADPGMIALGFAIYGCSNLFKTLRYAVLLTDRKIGTGDLFTITSYQNFFNIILPARTGELTLIYYLKKVAGTDAARGLHSLIITRIFDFIVISVFFAIAALMYFGSGGSERLIVIGALFFVASVIVLFNIKWAFLAFDRALGWTVRRFGLQDKGAVKFASDKSREVADEFLSFKTSRHVPLLALTTILTWTALYLLFYVSILALGMKMDFLRSVIGSTGGVLANVLPVNSFGSFGTLEAGWAGGFILVGMNPEDAIVSGFGYHIISLAASGTVALICLIIRSIRKKSS